MSWNIKTPGDYINGPLTVAGAATFNSYLTVGTAQIGGGKISVLGDFSSINGVVIQDSATTYANNDNFVLLRNSSGGVVGGITHPAVQSVGIWGVGGCQFFVGSSATTAATVDASGNFGIGVIPSAWSNNTALQLRNASSAITGAIYQGANAGLNANGIAYNCYFDGTNWKYIYGSAHPASRYQQAQGSHSWHIAPSSTGTATFDQAMTLDGSGNLYLGSSSSYLACRLNLQVTNAQPDAIYIRNSAAALSTYWRLGYVNSSNTFHILNQSGVGVYLTDGATSWTGTSDERLKDIIEPISNAVAKVGSLRSVIGKFKTDSEGTRRSFLIAQDVQSVFPEAVDMTNADAFGVRYTEVIPLLVAAIKELTARVVTIENA